MMVFDWLLVAAPVAFSALVFGLALGTEPIDLALNEMTTPSALVDRGFAPRTIDDVLERNVVEIVNIAGPDRAPGKIEIGTADTALNAYAEIINVEVPVRATQRLLRMVDYVAEVHMLIVQENTIDVSLHIRDSDTLKSAELLRYSYPFEEFDDLMDEMSSDIVGFLDPYILAVYLYKTSDQGPNRYEDVIEHVKAAMPISDPALIPWFYGLLGQIAEELNDPDLALDYYESAIAIDPEFYLAHVSWGRLLFDQGKISEALEQYAAALRIKPELASANLSIAQAMLAQGDYQEAFAALATAGELAPDFADVYEVRGNIYERLGLPVLARQQRVRAELARKREPYQNDHDTF